MFQNIANKASLDAAGMIVYCCICYVKSMVFRRLPSENTLNLNICNSKYSIYLEVGATERCLGVRLIVVCVASLADDESSQETWTWFHLNFPIALNPALSDEAEWVLAERAPRASCFFIAGANVHQALLPKYAKKQQDS